MSGVYRTANATVAAHSATSITPSDATVFPTTRALYVGTGGVLAVRMADDLNVVSFVNVANGTVLPIQVTQVLSTGTTASDIVALN